MMSVFASTQSTISLFKTRAKLKRELRLMKRLSFHLKVRETMDELLHKQPSRSLFKKSVRLRKFQLLLNTVDAKGKLLRVPSSASNAVTYLSSLDAPQAFYPMKSRFQVSVTNKASVFEPISIK
jgi:hypothetical protein